ncbi:MAG: hypothetical protein ACPIOQ_81405, partial [Promethearchaeia archaeon]
GECSIQHRYAFFAFPRRVFRDLALLHSASLSGFIPYAINQAPPIRTRVDSLLMVLVFFSTAQCENVKDAATDINHQPSARPCHSVKPEGNQQLAHGASE